MKREIWITPCREVAAYAEWESGKHVKNGGLGCNLGHLHQPWIQVTLDHLTLSFILVLAALLSIQDHSFAADFPTERSHHILVSSTVQEGETPTTLSLSKHGVSGDTSILRFLYWWQKVASDAESAMAAGADHAAMY